MESKTDLTQFGLPQTELFNLLSVYTLIQMHTDLLAQLTSAKPVQQTKISMTLSILEKTYKSKMQG